MDPNDLDDRCWSTADVRLARTATALGTYHYCAWHCSTPNCCYHSADNPVTYLPTNLPRMLACRHPMAWDGNGLGGRFFGEQVGPAL